MQEVDSLTPPQCILLATALAAAANINDLRSLSHICKDILGQELVLRILLSYLPESLDPQTYTSYLKELTSPDIDETPEHGGLDIDSVKDLSEADARKQLKDLRIHHIRHPALPEDATADLLTSFLIHRAHRIDSETGLFHLVPQLLEPFLGHSGYVRDFYVGTVLPLFRLGNNGEEQLEHGHTLEQFERLEGYSGVDALLSSGRPDTRGSYGDLGPRLRRLVAPWVCGRQRWGITADGGRRRRLEDRQTRQDQPRHEWQYVNAWLLSKAVADLGTTLDAVDDWAGPSDADFDGQEDLRQHYQQDEKEASRLQQNYCQCSFAALYAAEADDSRTIDQSHSMLVRIAELNGFEPPPELATSIHLLPRLERHAEPLAKGAIDYLEYDNLLRPDNPLTVPKLEAFSLLQMHVYSAYLLSGLGHPLSVTKITKLRCWSDESEQLRLLQRVLHGINRDTEGWLSARDTILWLWDWALLDEPEMPQTGYGMFGKIRRDNVEKEFLQAACTAGQYDLVAKVYILDDRGPLSQQVVEGTVVALVLRYYDEASNGNRKRGTMKKASDVVIAFRSHFPGSAALKRCQALIAATHAVSFYSLTLQKGIPTKPVSIRQTEDPIGLLQTIMEQNPGSYTQVDKLIEIGRDLVRAHSGFDNDADMAQSSDEEAEAMAERRITSMAIEAALSEDDFETAYSYVVNRLSPATNASSDEISWRAAYLAGRQRPSIAKPAASGTATSPQVRRLEQRMELLSQSLLLAPATALPEVLAAWRRCEEELLAVIASEKEAEEEFDDHADKRELGPLPGGFGNAEPAFMVQPKRKELGRGAAEEAPMGLFEVARGAAAAFGRSTNRQGTKSQPHAQEPAGERPVDSAERQRKRDIIANAVTGGMASGIGWVLGAKPQGLEDS